jgi:3-methylcrotonyl-CoA carboxylase alpha subunit
MTDRMTITRLSSGTYAVQVDGRNEVVYVAGPAGDRWAFWKGRIYRTNATPSPGTTSRAHVAQSLTAPMPATVIKILVTPGGAVKKGDTLVILEAMKMELPVRAPGDGRVAAIHCREGELVQPDTILIELE